ncbi:hypothetical protein GS534_27215 [Rhodococcus hoagii]|nr:hypothetical protein [Prescottella equi]
MKGVGLDVAVVAVTPSCAYGIAADVKKASTGWANWDGESDRGVLPRRWAGVGALASLPTGTH